ncbi:MAG: amidohydrolase family protein, partial [Terriglobia bacterium]
CSGSLRRMVQSRAMIRRERASSPKNSPEEAQSPFIPAIDTHIHLFDPGRPEGVPWPDKTDGVLYRAALPGRYRRVTSGLGIVGAIAVECSPWPEDNQWVLDLAAKHKIIVGVVGNLEPGDARFRKDLERLSQNPLFRGIRYGNLWGRNLAQQLSRQAFRSGLQALADAGLSLDTANPDPALITAVVRLTDRIPGLRVVVDHLPQLNPPTPSRDRAAFEATLKELATRPHVYVKVSEVLRRAGGLVPYDVDFYKPRLDELWETFGPDRLIYGSDWPNSDQWGPYRQVLEVVRKYFRGKGAAAAEKFFWRNSTAAYRWSPRDRRQPAQPEAPMASKQQGLKPASSLS